MSEIAVEVNGIWKKFRRGERQDSLRDLVPALVGRAMRRGAQASSLGAQDFWALQDVSFSIGRGKALGIIGHNGAGKSTLLKVLTRLLRPTTGTYVTRGKVGALIEVTAGFHTDLTGRENVYLNGAILGMRKTEIDRRFDQIVEFAGLGAFIDTPVKRYSSGMNARLGFSVAAHLEPEILIVDEVLSVGDFTFQGKCIRWMQEILRNGTTVIFVSHNMDAVLSLCDSAILLKQGCVLAQGEMTHVVAEYYRSGGVWSPKTIENPHVRTTEFTANLDVGGVAEPGQHVLFSHTFSADRDVQLSPGFFIKRDGRVVVDTTYARMHGQPLHAHPGDTHVLEWSLTCNLPAGVYEVGCHLEDVNGGYHDYQGCGYMLTIADDPHVKSDCYVGVQVAQRRLSA